MVYLGDAVVVRAYLGNLTPAAKADDMFDLTIPRASTEIPSTTSQSTQYIQRHSLRWVASTGGRRIFNRWFRRSYQQPTTRRCRRVNSQAEQAYQAPRVRERMADRIARSIPVLRIVTVYCKTISAVNRPAERRFVWYVNTTWEACKVWHLAPSWIFDAFQEFVALLSCIEGSGVQRAAGESSQSVQVPSRWMRAQGRACGE